jgi:dihydrolipoamide dehydrogenase
MAEQFDLTVIGTGPGGYVCAIRAAQLGLRVAVVEKRETHGGTCVNIGCIPSKALLHVTERYEEIGAHFSSFGIMVDEVRVDLAGMMKHKDKTVGSNTDGLNYLFKKNKITSFRGTGLIEAPGRVRVTPEKGDALTIATKSIVIATGSDSMPLKGVDVDEKRVVTSTGALTLDRVPERLLVIGAGVIGLELGSVWSRLGAKVQVVEFLDRILPGMDGEVAKQSQRLFEKQGFKFQLSSKVTGVDSSGKALKVKVEPAAGGEATEIETDVVLLAIGRRPFTEGLGLDKVGVALDERGRVRTDAHYATNIGGIYAIGDVIAGPMLAHKAEEEGVAVAEILAGQQGHVDYDVVPSVVYTRPEIAALGRTEEELKADGTGYKVSKVPFSANARARAMGATEGFAKLLADKATDRVLGAHVVGPTAGELIHELAVLMSFGGSAEDLARVCHAHPTLSESIRESALGAGLGTINL